MLLGAVVLVIAIVALRDPNSHVTSAPPSGTASASSSGSSGSASSTNSTHSSAKSSKKPSRTAGSATSSSAPAVSGVKAVPLVVLNNTQTGGLAKVAAARFTSGGWTVSSTGNLTNDIVSTCAYYDPAAAGARAAADALQQQFPTIQRVRVRFSGLPPGPVVVVLTPGYSAN